MNNKCKIKILKHHCFVKDNSYQSNRPPPNFTLNQCASNGHVYVNYMVCILLCGQNVCKTDLEDGMSTLYCAAIEQKFNRNYVNF